MLFKVLFLAALSLAMFWGAANSDSKENDVEKRHKTYSLADVVKMLQRSLRRLKSLESKVQALRPRVNTRNCQTLKADNPSAKSGVYWINPTGAEPFQAYCDMDTAGGGWTLVYSYTFTNYGSFTSGSNAVTPQPDWPSHGNVPRSTYPPLGETQYAAMHFNLWKKIGSEFMIKSNINHWIKCTEGTGSLLRWKKGSINCQVVKNIVEKCRNFAPRTIHFNWRGPILSRSLLFYYFDASTSSNWPTHDPCGTNKHNHIKGVANPHGNIYVR